MSEKDKIIKLALGILGENPGGIRYSELHRFIREADPQLNPNTINGTIWDLEVQLPKEVYKPSRGLYCLVRFRDKTTDQSKEAVVSTNLERIKEASFYKPFSEWLISEAEECTKAIPLGGNKFKDKWGTPDVIGKNESKKTDIIQTETQIVSAEIKTDTAHLIEAFGQACAYCLFSHKSYLVIPQESARDDIGRLDALCQVFGIGLILFNSSSPDNPEFDIRVRPRKQEPDRFYTNQYMRLIEQELFS